LESIVRDARAAVDRHDWQGALDVLEGGQDLGPDALLLKAEAHWWNAEPQAAEDSYEAAFAGFMAADRIADAAVVVGVLAYMATRRSAMAVASGWLSRLGELLEGQPESLGHVWNLALQQAFALFGGDVDTAITLGDKVVETARHVGVPSLGSIGMSFKGYGLIEKGEWRAGMKHIDEATILAMTPGTDLRVAADIYCNTIAACRDIADYRRATEWTDKAERGMEPNAIGGYPGVCKVHRAELKRLHGSWSEAMEQARAACLELERYRLLNSVGFARYEIAEIKRRMGDLVGAEQAFTEAHEAGHHCQPGLSLLLLDKGEPEEALQAVTDVLNAIEAKVSEDGSTSYTRRSRLLPAQVEAALAVGDVETAESAVRKLEDMADVFDGIAWQANAAMSRAALALHQGDATAAASSADEGWRLWAELDIPYEAARTRTLLGMALRADGKEGAAIRELKAARATLDRLGARVEVERVDELLGDASPALASTGRRTTKIFVFTDIVTSTDLIGLIGDEAWQELLEWHDRTLRQAIAAAGGAEVRHTGDGFFVTFDDARRAIDCAVDIQRRLAEHRRTHGFAPMVRIGMHRAEALERGKDYAGHGVHEAARVGGLAGAEEIVVSAAVLEAAGSLPYPVGDAVSETLKGIDDPVAVHRIDWG
jgi:class 3 adenylate cyclase